MHAGLYSQLHRYSGKVSNYGKVYMKSAYFFQSDVMTPPSPLPTEQDMRLPVSSFSPHLSWYSHHTGHSVVKSVKEECFDESCEEDMVGHTALHIVSWLIHTVRTIITGHTCT